MKSFGLLDEFRIGEGFTDLKTWDGMVRKPGQNLRKTGETAVIGGENTSAGYEELTDTKKPHL
jgi:hypothetical protein